MHRDLTKEHRHRVQGMAEGMVNALDAQKQSLALAREVFINAFDKAAAELDA